MSVTTGEQVRNALVDGQLQHLRVDHDHAHVARAGLMQSRLQHHRVQRHRLAEPVVPASRCGIFCRSRRPARRCHRLPSASAATSARRTCPEPRIPVRNTISRFVFGIPARSPTCPGSRRRRALMTDGYARISPSGAGDLAAAYCRRRLPAQTAMTGPGCARRYATRCRPSAKTRPGATAHPAPAREYYGLHCGSSSSDSGSSSPSLEAPENSGICVSRAWRARSSTRSAR